MEILDKFRGQPAGPDVPYWCRFFTPSQYERFVTLVEGYFQRRGEQVEIVDGVVLPQRMGLGNLAQLCHQSPDERWLDHVERHFRVAEQSLRDARQLERTKADLDAVRHLLAVRLYPEEHLQALPGAHLVYRSDLPGTISTLVYDLPHGLQSVRDADVEAWGVHLDKLFEMALDNVRRTFTARIESIALDNSSLLSISGESLLATTTILLLDDYPQCLGGEGTVAAVPNRMGVLAHPVEDASVLPALQALLQAVPRMYADGPGSISPRIYWYHRGEFLDLPYTIEGSQAEFRPPEEFVAMLNRVMGESGGEGEV